VSWEFTADNAIYSFYDTANDVHNTVDIRKDFAGEWVEDFGSETDDSYWILVNRQKFEFSLFWDEDTEEYDPTMLEYDDVVLKVQ
jgi:hypothetical protein